jgi:cysteinyl-tRNA synthetase
MQSHFRLYNTLSRSVENFQPKRAGHISLYVCGMTVYDEAHVGHARAMVVFDMVARYLRTRGWNVDFVRNFTDVDDKIIDRARGLGEDSAALAQRYIDAFRRDAAGLGLVPPTHEPRVTESIPAIITMILELIASGHAYVQGDSVWFAVDTYPHYGALSGQKVEALRSADVGQKRSSADFALWKGAKPGEPAWESPWGPGRPGWHIECSAMARACIGDEVDIHGGGLDLVFPHHENEVAQSECATRHRPFARYWMHNGLLTVPGGQKMGKSLGNVVNIHALLEQFPAEAIRLYYLQSHYRSPLPWSAEALPDALAMLARLYDAREAAEALAGEGDPDALARELGRDALEVLELGRTLPERFHAAMSDDFNTAQALGHAFELARAINRFANAKAAKKRGAPIVAPALAALREVESIGLLAMSTAEFQAEVKRKRLAALGIDPAAVEQAIAERLAARNAKDWARADSLRVHLDAQGIVVMDRPEGVEWRVRLESPGQNA